MWCWRCWSFPKQVAHSNNTTCGYWMLLKSKLHAGLEVELVTDCVFFLSHNTCLVHDILFSHISEALPLALVLKRVASTCTTSHAGVHDVLCFATVEARPWNCKANHPMHSPLSHLSIKHRLKHRSIQRAKIRGYLSSKWLPKHWKQVDA